MRLEGWEERLTLVVESARARPYQLGKHDCFTFACEVIEALTGRKLGDGVFGCYSNEEEAMAVIRRYGKTLEEAGSVYSGLRRIAISFAQRGDICALKLEDKTKHLAVCLGDVAACLGPSGLLFVPRESCLCAWKVE